jgi:nitrous oxide reductase accessory protein NosL
MQKILIFLLLCLVLPYPAVAATPTVEAPPACEKCGMDRTRFAHSRMLIEYADHSVVGLCSLHCVAEELAQHPEKPVQSLKVADYNTKELIDAATATWVIGGSKKGVMTFVPKWAFLHKEEAQAFVAENGGEVTTFDAALQAAKEELTGEGSMKTHGKHQGK